MSCYCTQCFPSKPRARRTVQRHLKADLDAVRNTSCTPEYMVLLERSIQLNTVALESEAGYLTEEGLLSFIFIELIITLKLDIMRLNFTHNQSIFNYTLEKNYLISV